MIECQEGAGFHSLVPDQLFHEVVNPETGERLPDGQSGMLAFTHLMRRGTLFLRYLVGDVVTLSHEPARIADARRRGSSRSPYAPATSSRSRARWSTCRC